MQVVSLSYHVFNLTRTNWHCHYLNDHHAVTVPIYLCNCNLLPLSTSQQKQNPQQKKSQVNQQEQTEWMRPPFFLFYLRDIQPFINPVFPPFLLLSPLSVPHLSIHTSTGWEKGRFVDYYKRSSIRGYPNLGETTYRDTTCPLKSDVLAHKPLGPPMILTTE